MRGADGTTTIILYGELPEPVYVLRIPSGVKWQAAMLAARRLVKQLTNTPRHKAAPRWNIDGDPPDWDTTKFPRYLYTDKEFLPVE